jgi:hypothetical protein
MAEQIDATVEAVETSRPKTLIDGVGPEADAEELGTGHHPVLPGS